MKTSRQEAEVVMFSCVENLFSKTGLKPKEVDILVVNCSLFNPTPSLAAMIINHFKMRPDTQAYNLSGMGCSASLISVRLAEDLLRNPRYANSNALIMSFENITENIYLGPQKSMQISNTLFRCGGAAIHLTNKPSLRSQSKYQLLHTVRTHMGQSDQAYGAVFQDCDTQGTVGVRLDKGLMVVAGEALKKNMTTLAPLILPYSEQAKYALSLLHRYIHKLRHGSRRRTGTPPRVGAGADDGKGAQAQVQAQAQTRCPPKAPPMYIPDFTTAVDHFAIHAGS